MPRDCPTSSTETVVLPRDQQDMSSSLGNSIGGKRVRRQADEAHDDAEVVDVVYRGDGHANSSFSQKTNANKLDDDKSGKQSNVSEEEEVEVIVEKRILLNISIGMDDGFGASHLDVYHLQVAVPLPKQRKAAQNFFTYKVVDDSLMEENLMPVHAAPTMTTIQGDHRRNNDDSSPFPSDENLFDGFIESSTDEGLKNETTIQRESYLNSTHSRASEREICVECAQTNGT